MTGPNIARVGRSAAGRVVRVDERDQITGVAGAPSGVPLLLVKGADGLLRPLATDSSGALTAYEHVQVEPSDTWVVDHNLGRYPTAWSLFDAQDHLRDEFLVDLPTVNRAVIRMDVVCAGSIRMI